MWSLSGFYEMEQNMSTFHQAVAMPKTFRFSSDSKLQYLTLGWTLTRFRLLLHTLFKNMSGSIRKVTVACKELSKIVWGAVKGIFFFHLERFLALSCVSELESVMGWHKIISVLERSSRNFKETSLWEGFSSLWTTSWTNAGGYNSSEQFFILLD